MSTRATYRFQETPSGISSRPTSSNRNSTTIYIRHDGYPLGAAIYFYSLLMKPSKGCLATQFIRANEGAEITEGHEVHGDTQFMYDVTGTGPGAELKMISIGYDSKGKRIKRPGFVGTLTQFIDQELVNCKEEPAEWVLSACGCDYKPFKLVKFGYREMLLNEHTARLELNSQHGILSSLRSWFPRAEYEPGKWSANWVSTAGSLKALVEAFPGLWCDEFQIYIDTLVEAHPSLSSTL